MVLNIFDFKLDRLEELLLLKRVESDFDCLSLAWLKSATSSLDELL